MQPGKLMSETANKKQKTTDVIIEQIRDVILSGHLKPGDRLASEKELIEQFGVSKATLREALRALEVMGLVQSRKGASGGLFITEVNLKTTIHSLMNFLHFRSLSVSELTMLRFMIEPMIVRIVASRITGDEIDRLHALSHNYGRDDGNQRRHIGFHRYLARITSNAMLILIIDMLESLLEEIKQVAELDADFFKSANNCHREIVDLLAQKDGIGASNVMADEVVMVGRYLSEKLGEPFENPKQFDLPPRQAETGPAGQSQVNLEELKGYVTQSVITSQDNSQGSKANGTLLKEVGKGTLYLFVPDTSPGMNDDK